MVKRMMVGLTVAAACGVLMGDGVTEFITDRSGYVTLGADNASGKSSFNTELSWSDGAAPSEGKDYLIQGNHIMRILATGTFAGRSLTLDNGRIKSGFGGGTATINDLRIYGGRLEQSVGNSVQTYAGDIYIYGTAAVPARISGSSDRTFNINSTLHGGTANAVRVMMTDEDSTAMTANYFICWFNADNSATYNGRIFVTGGNGTGSGAAWGHKIGLYAKSLANLGAGDPDVQTSILTLQNRGAFFGSNGMAFTNPAYSIAIDGEGTLGGVNAAGANACGLEVGNGVRIRGLAADSTIYIAGAAPVLLDGVQISNIGKIVTDGGQLRLGQNYANDLVELAINPNTTLLGANTSAGPATFYAGSSFSPGAATGDIATLKVKSARLEGADGNSPVVNYDVDIVRENGTLRADRLVVAGKLTGGTGAKIVFNIGSFPSGTDWTGSVCLLSASNLGEADGLQISDFEITGFPADWAGSRDSGEFSVESDGDTKYLMWSTALSTAPVVRILPLGDDLTAAAGSYRTPLAGQLATAGYRPDFVGSCLDGSASDPDHEGHAGWTLADAETWLGGTSLAAPHFILLHLGMNDLARSDFSHAKDRLARLVEGITTKYPTSWVLVSTLLARDGDGAEAANEAIDTLFNPYVAEVVADFRNIGRRVMLCDQHAAVSVENLAADGIHPTADGYAQMAAAWFTAIRTIMVSPMVAPSSTRSDLISLAGVDPGQSSSWNTGLNWENHQPPVAGSYYFVPTNMLLRTPDGQNPQPFAGESLIFNGGKMNIKHAINTTATANWVLYDCQLAHGCGGAKDASGNLIPWVFAIGGTMDIRSTVAAPTRFVGSGAGGSRTLQVDAAMRGGPDALVAIARTPGEVDDDSSKGFRCELRGDNSAYKGRFLVDREGNIGYHVAHFGSHAALGAPVMDGPKVTLKNGTTLSGAGLALTNGYAVAVEGSVTFSTTASSVTISGRRNPEGFYLGNGGSITGDGTSVIKVPSNAGSALSLDDVALTGIAGLELAYTVRVYPGYNHPEVPVTLTGSNGMLADNSDGIGDVILDEQGRLQPGFGITGTDAFGQFTMESLTMRGDSYLILSMGQFNGVVTGDFIRVRGNLVNERGTPIPVHVDVYPDNVPVGSRIPLLSAANLGTDVTAADFVAISEYPYIASRLEGTFEVAPLNGENVLFYTTGSRPVVRLTGTDASGSDSWVRAGYWDNKLAPSDEYDYAIPSGALLRRSTGGDNSTFAGHSLSILEGGDFAINGQTAKIDDLRLFSNGILTTRNNGNANRLQGTATVYAEQGKPFNFEIESADNNTRTLNLEATLQGSGDLRFRYYHTSSAPGAVCTYYLVTADNSGFTGGIELFQRAVCTDFKDERAMGGPAPAFRADRLLFTSNATLRCSSSYVMSDPTRGITFGAGVLDGALDGGTIEVAAGQTLTISNRIAGTTSFRKTGLGTLVLCCATNTFSGTVRNQGSSGGSYGAGGIIAVGHADALANATLEIYSNTVWRVDAPEGMTVKGLGAVVQNASRDGRFLVRPQAFENASGGKIVVNLVRFKGATAADAETALALVEVDASALGKSWKIETEAVPEEDALLVRATAAPASMVIILR